MDKADEQRLLRHAWDYGHFRNPLYPDTHNVVEADLATLSPLGSHRSRDAIASVQMSDCQCDEMCRSMFHGRPLVADGHPGPATMALIDIPRCRVPDFATDDDEYGQAGTIAWQDCDPTVEHDHEVVIRFDDRNATSTWKAYLPKVKSNVVALSAEMGLSLRHIDWDSNENYHSSIRFIRISGNTIGYFYFPQGGCKRIPQGALDTGYNPDVEMASILTAHEEAGHGVGLGHRPAKRDSNNILRGIENPSIVRVPLTWRGDPSEGDMIKLYSGVPLEPDDPPDPPDDKPIEIATFKSTKAGQEFKIFTGSNGGGNGWF